MAFNIPLALWGYETIKQNAAHCNKVWWLWVNAIMAAFHIVGSIYIVYRIQKNNPGQHPKGPYDRELQGYHEADSKVPHRHVQVKTNTDDMSSVHFDSMSKSGTSSVDSREPLYKKRDTVQAVDSTDAGVYQNMDHPHITQKVNSPRSVNSNNTSKSKSLFRNMFNNTNAETTTPNRYGSNKIESVASMLAGLPDNPDDGPANSFQRLGQVLCYDAGVALYFFVAVLWVIWQSVGVTVAISLAAGSGYDGDDDVVGNQCDKIKGWVVLSTVCGFLYMMLVFFAFGCSLLCLR
jgi:hypothetical protein